MEREDYFVYSPQQGTQLDSGTIVINIESKDIHTKPKQSYLLFEGTLTDSADLPIPKDTLVLENNAMAYLFNNMTLRIGGIQIESVYNPGQATTMLGMLKYPDDFNKSRGLNLCWYPDTSTTLINNNGAIARHAVSTSSFQFAVPLEHIFSFVEDYPDTLYGVKLQLFLDRAPTTADAVFGTTASTYKLKLNTLDWVMPQIKLGAQEQIDFLTNATKQKTLEIETRVKKMITHQVPTTNSFSWNLGSSQVGEKPEWLVVAFQTGKSNSKVQNSAIFDNLDLTSCFVNVNGYRYPMTNFTYDFKNNKIAALYHNIASFQVKYYGCDEMNTNPGIRPTSFKELFPLLVFDLRKQIDSFNVSTSDITFHADFKSNVPASTIVYGLVLSHKTLTMTYIAVKILDTYFNLYIMFNPRSKRYIVSKRQLRVRQVYDIVDGQPTCLNTKWVQNPFSGRMILRSGRKYNEICRKGFECDEENIWKSEHCIYNGEIVKDDLTKYRCGMYLFDDISDILNARRFTVFPKLTDVDYFRFKNCPKTAVYNKPVDIGFKIRGITA